MTTIIKKGTQMREIKRKPTHPGRILKEDYLTPLSITITEMSLILGISRKTLSKIINERGGITPDMALRLSRALDTTPDLWMNLQKNIDLWEASYVSQEWKSVKQLPLNRIHSNA